MHIWSDLYNKYKNGYITTSGYSQGAIWFYNSKAPQICFRNAWDEKFDEIRLRPYVYKYSFWVWRTFTEGIEGWICSPDYHFVQTLAQFHRIKKIWTVKCFFRHFYSSFPLKKSIPGPKKVHIKALDTI